MELMVAVAVVGILTTIALPAYQNYVLRGKLTEAFNAMTTCTMSLGRYYQDNRTFLGADQTKPPTCDVSTPNFTYQFKLSSTDYLVTAQGNASSPVALFTFTIDNSGAHATPYAPPGWMTSDKCWVISPSNCL